MNKQNKMYIDQLHPDLQKSATNVVNEIDALLNGRATFMLTYAYRTDSHQDELYELGRTKVNPNGKSKQRPLGYKVTNAKGGDSIHNYRMAVDGALLIDDKTMSWDDVKDFDNDGKSDWMECVAIFKKHGWVWGGDWSSFIDKPHFQYTFGLTLKQLKLKRAAKDFIPGTNYINVGKQRSTERITTAGVNLRTGPGVSYPVLLVLPIGTKVVSTGTSGDWTYVTFGPKIGFVATKYLK